MTGFLDLEFRVVHAGGKANWLHVKGSMSPDRRVGGRELSGVVFDIDSRRRAEDELRSNNQRLQSILDMVPDAMIVIDEAGIVTSFSAVAERLFGYRAEEIVGRNINKLSLEIDRNRHDSSLEHDRRTNKPPVIHFDRVLTGQRKDGTTFPMLLAIGEVVRADCGSITEFGHRHFIGFIRDLTEQQKTQAKLHELQVNLFRLSRLSLLGGMASSFAHELNQPLAAINNYLVGVQRLLEGNDDSHAATIRAALDKAARQTLRAGDIIRHLRDFISRNESDKRIVRIAHLLEETCDLALAGAHDMGIVVHVQVASEVNCVLVDTVQIQQVLVNLLRNALEAMQDTVRRELTVAATLDSSFMVEILVSDTGHGVPEDYLPRLFEPFMTTKETGMGIGLSISKTIIEAHGGRLWVETNPFGGTTFRFTIPSVNEE
ncbi:PAS domain S-box protein [Methylocapsa sp. D3K7]|uniref:two-component system sensor histidine kinase NtrB n=1 Tax=Methylocapsa sp. D3K7 TaxID=3041435 RepID=UPI00244EA0A7|nr:PAS domain S-box protein [Methylocapsa sp. D3K7]WGJ15395.1 PAS domain S-box protein [Methylocapsa sp. D3K7]